MSSKDDKYKENVKKQNPGSIPAPRLLWALRTGSPQKSGEGKAKGLTPRLSPKMRKNWTSQDTWPKNRQDTYAQGDPLNSPHCAKNKPHLLHEPPQNLEKLKLRVTFLVTEIKAKYPEQTMKQSEGQSGMLVRDWNPKIKQMSSGGSGKQKSHASQTCLQTYKQAPISRNTHESIGILFDWPVGMNTGDRQVSVLTSQRKLLGLVS